MNTNRTTREEATAVLERFAVDGALLALEPHGGGHINDSWQAAFAGGAAAPRRFLLQRINRHVFRRPSDVMENMVRVTEHVERLLRREGLRDVERRTLQLVPTREGATHHVDAAGETWRLSPWIEGTRATERAATTQEAYATAFAFGRFTWQLADLPGPRLHETIPGFHDTPSRLAAFRENVVRDPAGRAASCRPEVDALLERAALATALSTPFRQGTIRERAVHNDAKIANVLFDTHTGEALCVVDLDTVMPGLALHDFGDLARTAVSDSDEDERDLERVAVRVPFYEALVRGFLDGARGALSPAERALLATGALVITYEQALRFLGDHVDGDRYYRIARPGHNLERARAQLALVASLEREKAVLDRFASA